MPIDRKSSGRKKRVTAGTGTVKKGRKVETKAPVGRSYTSRTNRTK